ncbi:SAM-dependent methyltransferase [Neobacillus piezotolerans]|uniref:tRNA 5-hydroxyuridine methyltransferase n=1 Tax=Neobacillus piezotolerans TaxID=2259171 RepID=A0A3D8GKX4_9BACI|nr:O-methyltransferase [Neobacillus piezotolerans]RDU35105.1 SAM-dependent methyltransferase [Neobacillus piezotolerans]
MLDEKLQTYLDSLIPARTGLFAEMEAYAKEFHVPIMEPSGMEALLQILRIHNPKTILEIGTAIGYSALRMAEALPEAKIITIERDEERYREAEKNVEAAGASGRVELLLGDALEAAGEVGPFAPFDAIFIDAAKGQYQKFFSLYAPLLRAGGIMVTDNVLFKGLVYGREAESGRLVKLAEKIQGYNSWLTGLEDYATTIIPVGDGVAISYKKR